jgi:hypothetical protein
MLTGVITVVNIMTHDLVVLHVSQRYLLEMNRICTQRNFLMCHKNTNA